MKDVSSGAVDEPTAEDTISILRGLKDKIRSVPWS